MPGADVLRTEERLEFSSDPPYALVGAHRRSSKGIDTHEVHVKRIGSGYRANVTHTNSNEIIDLDWSYGLEKHLSLEGWLAHFRPPRGAEFTTQLFDFDRLMPRATRFTVAEAVADGSYVLRNASPLEDTLLDISPDLAPRALVIAGAFFLLRVEGEVLEDLPLRTRTHSPLARVPLTDRIPEPQRVTHLELATDRMTAAVLGSAGVELQETEDGPVLIVDVRATEPSNQDDMEAALGATIELPVTSPEIERLAARVPLERDARAQVAALIRFVGTQLVYDERTRSTHLSDSLRTGRGDCTEFADLFTTLARALGIPARGVEGLVYAETAGPGFYLHAWSQVALEGHWVSVDPTTGQDRVDATHLPFPRTDSGFLRAYAALPDLRLAVQGIRY